MAIMREVGVSKTTVWRWQEYFSEAGVEGLVKGRSKPPGRQPLSAAIKLKVVEKTVKEHPAHATHWSVRAMAEVMGISHTSVQRIWAEYGLKPHLMRRFKISNAAIGAFAESYGTKYDKAVDCLTKDTQALLAFYDFPAEHGKHLRTSNPIESTFATVRHRTIRSKGCLSNKTALAMVFKLVEGAQKSWRRLDGHNLLPKLIQGVKVIDGIEPVRQEAQTAAA